MRVDPHGNRPERIIMANENTTQAAAQAAPASAPAVQTADENTMELALSSDRFGHMDIAADLSAGKAAYCTMQAEDNKARVTLFNACTNPMKISDMINKRIEVLHIYAEIIQVVSEQTGEMVNVPRVILIDKQGKGYQAVSIGIYNAVKRMIALFGNPSQWDKPHTVEVQNVSLANGQHTFNLIMVD